MSFFRSVFLASLVSLLAALALLFIGFSMGYEEFRGGYAVLTVDDSVNDRELRSLLETSAFFVGDPISESSQWVLLDEFDSIQRIPLDKYFSRVFYFDPRYDGYADKLRSIFVRDGKRFVYLPLMAGNWNTGHLNKNFSDLLGDISFSVNYYGIGRPLTLFFVVYIVSSVILLILCYLKRKIHRSIVNIIPMIPVLSSLGFFGAAGIGCAGLLFGLFILLKEPLGDLVNPAAPSEKGFKKRFNQIKKEIILPYRNFWYFLPVFIMAFSVLIIFSQLKFLFLLLASAVSFAVFFFSLKIVSFSGVEHKRFNPITIVKRRFPEFVFPIYILPFVIGAFITMFFTPYMSGTYDSSAKFDALVDEQDYIAHVTYQASFSTRQMGPSQMGTSQMGTSQMYTSYSSFPSFSFDADGLPSMNAASGSQYVRLSDFPPFPLKYLMEFFNNVNNGSRMDADISGRRKTGGIAERLSLLILLLFLFPGFIAGKTENVPKITLDSFKRFSGSLRSAGINWNINLLYNKKNQTRSRKDA